MGLTLDDEGGDEGDTQWTISSWIASLSLEALLSDSLMSAGAAAAPEGCTQVSMQLAFVQEIGSLDSPAAVRAILASSDMLGHLATRIWEGARRLHSQNDEEVLKPFGKFCASEVQSRKSGRILSYGGIDSFFGGLVAKIGPANAKVSDAMVSEHTQCEDSRIEFTTSNYQLTTTSEIEWSFVTEPDADIDWPKEAIHLAGGKHRRPMSISKLEAHMATRNAALSDLKQPPLILDEAFGARLYTGPLFAKYNTVLRGFRSSVLEQEALFEDLCRGNPYVTTLHVINSAVTKLGKVSACTDRAAPPPPPPPRAPAPTPAFHIPPCSLHAFKRSTVASLVRRYHLTFAAPTPLTCAGASRQPLCRQRSTAPSPCLTRCQRATLSRGSSAWSLSCSKG